MQAAQFELHAQVESRHWWFRARAGIVGELVRELVPPGLSQRVIEVGCGTGGTLASLSHDYQCLGIDPDDNAIDLAQRRFPTIEFRSGYAPKAIDDALPHADAVLLLDVLEHVADDAGLLRSLVQDVSPGTYLLATVPADMTLWSPHDEAYGHYRRYDIPTFRNLWRDLPVSQQLLAPMNTRLHGCVRASRALSSLRDKAAGCAGTDLRLPSRPLNWALERIFAGERHALVNHLRHGETPPMRRGVSLVSVLKRNA